MSLLFVSVVREGLSTRLGTEDTGASSPLLVDKPLDPALTLKVSATVGSLASNQVSMHMLGPADVAGFDPRVVLRTDPSPGAQTFDRERTGHAELDEDQARDERRSIESHPTVRQDAVAIGDERGAEPGDRAQLRQAGKLLVVVVDREVDIQTMIRHRRDARVEPAFEIDDNVNPAPCDRLPLLQRRGDEQTPVVVDLK